MGETPPVFEYDAFISYRRSERVFARQLEEALEAYRPPRGLGLPDRRLNVFRDESDLDGSDYYGAIDDHIERSRKLVVLCSPAARGSDYVDKEIEAFVRLRGKEHIVSVLIDGVPNDEAGDDEAHRKAFPEALCRALGVPLASNYLGFVPGRDRPGRGGFEGAWYTVLANLLDVSRSLLEERERKRAQRRRRLVAGTVSGVMAALLALAAWALVERVEARRQSVISQAQRLAAQSQLVLGTRPARLERSVLLGVQAVRLLQETGERRPEVERALREAAALLPPLRRRIAQDGAVQAFASGETDGHVTALIGSAVTRWDLASGRRLGGWTVDAPVIRAVAMASPLAAVADRHALRVLDLETGRGLAEIPAEMVRAVALHPGAGLVAAARSGADRGGAVGDDTVRVWRIGPGALEPLWMAENQPGVVTLAFGPEGDILAAASRDAVSIWRLAPEAGALVATLRPGGGRLAFSPDGKRLAVAGDNAVRNWQPFDDPPAEIQRIDQVGVRDVVFAPDGVSLATSGADRTARLWSVPDGRELLRMPHTASVGAVQFAAGGAHIVTGSGARLADDDAIRVWEWRASAEEGGTGADAGLLALAQGRLRRVTGPGGGPLHAEVVAGEDALPAVRVWRPADEHTRARIGHDGPIAAFGLSADGSVLATAGGARIRVFELAPLRERAPLELDRPVHRLAVGPAGRWLLASTRSGANVRQDNVAWLWDLATDAEPRRLEHDRRVLAVAIAGDGARIATSWVGGATRVWSTDPLAPAGELPLARDVTALGFGAAPWMLATGSSDRTARLWDVRTGSELARFDHREGVVGLAFTAGGDHLVTASFAAPFRSIRVERPLTVRVWSLTPEDALADACRRLTRDLTDAERAAYASGGPLFDPTCP